MGVAQSSVLRERASDAPVRGLHRRRLIARAVAESEAPEDPLAALRRPCRCGQPASWMYGPSDGGSDRWRCAACVPRGCSCTLPIEVQEAQNQTLRWGPKGEMLLGAVDDTLYGLDPHDAQGRKSPCIEWGFVGDDLLA